MPSVKRLAVTTLGTFKLLGCENVFDQSMSRQASDLAEDENRGAFQPKPLGMSGKVGDGCGDTAFILAARVLHADHGKGRGEARVEQLLGNHPCGGDTHIDEEGVLTRGESSQIEVLEARLLAPRLMARQESDRMRDVAMGERDLQARRCRDPSRDARDDLDRNAGFAQRIEFLAAAAEDKGIAPLQPDHRLARPRARDENRIDFALRYAVLALRLADGDELCLAARMIKDA